MAATVAVALLTRGHGNARRLPPRPKSARGAACERGRSKDPWWVHDGAMGDKPQSRGDAERLLSTEAVIRRALGRDVGRLLSFDPIAREGRDPEGVHQLRVAARRLRAELKICSMVLKTKPAKGLRHELHWLGTTLGAERDLDVLSVSVAIATTAPGADDLRVAIAERLDLDRAKSHHAVIVALGSDRYRALIRRLCAAVTDPPLRRQASAPAAAVLDPALARSALRLDTLVSNLGDRPADEQLHRLRLATKQLRYGAELATAYAGEPAANTAADLAVLQTELGELHDAGRVLGVLAEVRRSRPRWQVDGPEALALQGAIDAEERAKARSRAAWATLYGEARRSLIELGWLGDPG